MTKKLLKVVVFLFFSNFLSFYPNDILAEQVVLKEICLSSFGMDWKTSEEAKSHIITIAKREAVGELFGEMIRSFTSIEDFQLKKDRIEAHSSGLIRLKGVPEFRNGKGFGEICVKIIAYITDEDIVRFKPRKVRKKVCISDPRLSLGEVRKTAEQQARLQAVRDYEPELEHIKDDIVLTLIHEAKTDSAGFIPETTAYCVTASGIIYPIELMAVTETASNFDKTSNHKKKKGIQIVSGSYGLNCGASYGNVTDHLVAACNGKCKCQYTIDYQVIGDPAVGCRKNYVAEWKCGENSKQYSVKASPEAGYRKTITIECDECK